MGNLIYKIQPFPELTPAQIAMLQENTKYTEKQVRDWHAKLLHSSRNRKLTLQKFIEEYQKFYEKGKKENSNEVDLDIEPLALRLGDEFPNVHLKTTLGDFYLYDWIGQSSWCILFSHPADFTAVCTTELSRAANLTSEFRQRNVKCIALSCDSVENHRQWIEDLLIYGHLNENNRLTCESDEFPFPIIEDTHCMLAKKLGMIDPDQFDSKGCPLTARAVFVIGPDKKLKASILYPATTGRNFDEIIRLLDSLQLSARLPVATPVDWQVGQKVMVPSNVRDEDIKKYLPHGVEVQSGLPSGKIYIRMTEV